MNDATLKTIAGQTDNGGKPMSSKLLSGCSTGTKVRLILGAGLIGAASAAANAQWYLEVGPVYRGDMKLSVRGGSSAAQEGATAARDGTTGGGTLELGEEGLPIDDGTAQVLREFDNGYVGPSGWPWANVAGTTQFFAYDDAAQYDAAANTLTYQITLGGGDTVSQRRTVTRTRTDSEGWKGSKRMDGAGLMATLGYRVREEESWSLGLQGRIGWLDDIQGGFRNREAFRQSIERSTYETSVTRGGGSSTYTYDTLGNPAFPAAPYEMSNPAGVGPMIADTPRTITHSEQTTTATDRLVRRTVATAASYVDLNVDAQAFTFQAGPRLLWQPAERLALLVQPALTANLLDVDVRRQETFRRPNGTVIATWSDHSSDQAWRMGAGVQAGAQVALSEQWSLTAAGGYEWVDKYSRSTGPDRISIDLSGFQLELAVGRSF